MSITATLGRITSTLVAILHTRLDLIRVELEEEVIRFSSYFMYALIALFCGGVAVSFILVLILVLFWDDHRITVILSYIALFSILSAFIFSWLKKQIANKPHLLEQSIAEFRKDIELLRAHEQEPDQQTGREL
jgi:uncharacterized membrane protein YqjE